MIATYEDYENNRNRILWLQGRKEEFNTGVYDEEIESINDALQVYEANDLSLRKDHVSDFIYLVKGDLKVRLIDVADQFGWTLSLISRIYRRDTLPNAEELEMLAKFNAEYFSKKEEAEQIENE